MNILTIILLLIIISFLIGKNSLTGKIILYSIGMFLLGFFLFLIFIDEFPILAFIIAGTVFIFWVIEIIKISKLHKLEDTKPIDINGIKKPWTTLGILFFGFFGFIILIDFSFIWAIIVTGIIFLFFIKKFVKIFNKNSLEEIKTIHSDRNKNSYNNQDENKKSTTYHSVKNINTLNEQLAILDIGGKKWTHFTFQNGKTIKIQSSNLAKICYKTIQKHNKNIFKNNELQEDLNYFKNNYKTSLDEETYNKVLSIIEKFVKEGGTLDVL